VGKINQTTSWISHFERGGLRALNDNGKVHQLGVLILAN